MAKFVLTIEANSFEEIAALIKSNAAGSATKAAQSSTSLASNVVEMPKRETTPESEPPLAPGAPQAGFSIDASKINTGEIQAVDDASLQATAQQAFGTPAASVEVDDSVPLSTTEVDSTGLPWDARIHSGNKGRNKDGSWRKLKGVDKATVAAVEAELRARNNTADSGQSEKTETAEPPAEPQVTDSRFYAAETGGLWDSELNQYVPEQHVKWFDNGSWSVLKSYYEPVAPTAPTPAPAPVSAPAAPAAPAQPTQSVDFAQLMQVIANLMKNGAVDNSYIAHLQAKIGVPTLASIVNDPAKIAQVVQIMSEEGKWQ